MNRRKLIQLATALLSTAGLPAISSASKQSLVVGIFPRRNIKVTFRMFTPLVEYLQQQTGLRVELKTERTFADFWQAVKSRKYDLVHYNQYHYILSHLQFGYEVVAKNKELGRSSISGALVVRKDSGIEKITDLKGKLVLFGGNKTAMQSYIAATWLLRKGGLMEGDYIEKFAINPPNTLISTYFKRADASGSGDMVMHLDNVTSRIDINQLKVLAKTDPMPHLPWAIREDLAEPIKQLIRDSLLDLGDTEQGQAVLKSAGLDALVPADDAEYDAHRKIIKDVYGESMGASKL